MFKSIKENWNKAEATELRKEFVDMVKHIQSRGLSDDPVLAKYISRLIENLSSENGQDIFSISEKGKKTTANALIKKARKIGGEQFVPAAGMSVMAMALKASYLPGEDADFVKEHCSEIIKAAIDESQ